MRENAKGAREERFPLPFLARPNFLERLPSMLEMYMLKNANSLKGIISLRDRTASFSNEQECKHFLMMMK